MTNNREDKMETSIHKFEQAGLGKAPFRYVGFTEKRGPIRTVLPNGIVQECGAPGQPMGTCDYCGQGIAICCEIVSADGKRFVVGSDCVEKTGDAGLRKVKTDVQKRARENQKAREQQRISDMRARLASDDELRSKLSVIPHPQQWRAEKGETLLDSVEWMMDRAGHSGQMKTVRAIERVLKGTYGKK